MRIINADGTEAEMCGNGIRCLALFIQELEAQQSGFTAAAAAATASNLTYSISTLAGKIITEVSHSFLYHGTTERVFPD